MKLQLRHYTITFLILLSIQNTINISIEGRGLIDYILFSGIFLLFALAIVLLEKKWSTERIHGILFIFSGLLIDIFGARGNMTSIMLYSFAIYFLRNKKITVAVLATAIVALFIKAYFTELHLTLLFNEFIFRGYLFLLYYINWHPKPVEISYIEGMTAEQSEIIQYLIRGKKPKEMQDLLVSDLSVDAIYKKIGRLREKYGYGTNEQMIWDIAKNGRLRQQLE